VYYSFVICNNYCILSSLKTLWPADGLISCSVARTPKWVWDPWSNLYCWGISKADETSQTHQISFFKRTGLTPPPNNSNKTRWVGLFKNMGFSNPAKTPTGFCGNFDKSMSVWVTCSAVYCLGHKCSKVFPGFNAYVSTWHEAAVWASFEAAWRQGQ